MFVVVAPRANGTKKNDTQEQNTKSESSGAEGLENGAHKSRGIGKMRFHKTRDQARERPKDANSTPELKIRRSP